MTIVIRRYFEQRFDHDKCLEFRPIKAGSLRHQCAEAVEEWVRDDLQKLKEEGVPRFMVGVEAPMVQVLQISDGAREDEREEMQYLVDILQ